MNGQQRQVGFTGRHMLFAMLAFFGVIVGVNFTMAWFARTSWTGFVVQNSYVASQQFNEKMAETRAQKALGWTGQFSLKDGTIGYTITDAGGAPVPLKAVAVTFKRPVDDSEDHTVVLTDGRDGLEGTDALADGVWLVDVSADAALPNPYRETRRIHVVGGSSR